MIYIFFSIYIEVQSWPFGIVYKIVKEYNWIYDADDVWRWTIYVLMHSLTPAYVISGCSRALKFLQKRISLAKL